MQLLPVLAVLAVLAVADAQKPYKPPTYQMNMSTIIMPCNYSGFTDPKTTIGWAIIDFDWSNGKQIWAKNHPMNDEELLQQQVGLPCREGCAVGASPPLAVEAQPSVRSIGAGW
jgi:hypothetical protein